MRRTLFTTAAALAAATALAAPATAAESMYATTATSELVNFASDEPRKILARHKITGLEPFDYIFAIDFRPANGKLYGLGRQGRMYTIDTATGVATAVARETFDPQLNGKAFGFDFNPVVDRIRLVSDADQNLRLNPNDGKVAAVDKNLMFEVGTSTQEVLNPHVVASAYTNNVAGATSTQLYGLDAQDNSVVIQDPPNDGTIKRVGRFGTSPIGDDASFDIARDGTAYAAFRVNQRATLFRVDLGAPVNAGQPAAADPVIGDGIEVTGLAAAGPIQPPATPPATPPAGAGPVVGATAKRRSSRRSLRERGLAVSTRCSEACGLTATLRIGDSVLGTARGRLDAAGTARLVVKLNATGRQALATRGRRKLILRVTGTAAGGKTVTVRRGVVVR